jgi:hypothetical protein
VHLIRVGVCSPESFFRARQHPLNVSGIDAERVFARLLLQITEKRMLRWQCGARPPAHAKSAGRKNRTVLLFRNDSDEVLANYHFDETRDVAYRRFINGVHCRPISGGLTTRP